ncbi:MAG: CAP domain-containing protein [Ktedonobacteraceae bacterium]
MNRKFWYLLSVCMLVPLVAACAQSSQTPSVQAIHILQVTPTPGLMIVQQLASSTPTPTPTATSPARYHGAPPTNIPASGSGPAPYGPAPTPSALDIQYTQQLFTLINQDRATRGLPAYTWNATLEGGARLHSWNMYHCGFSHTCPDGVSQFTRIANEGFAGLALGECIGLAGPSNPPWAHIYQVQESMINEPPSGFHRITLTSTKLHRGGVGIYVDPTGWVWFTEDFAA